MMDTGCDDRQMIGNIFLSATATSKNCSVVDDVCRCYDDDDDDDGQFAHQKRGTCCSLGLNPLQASTAPVVLNLVKIFLPGPRQSRFDLK
jgi:hypothetical protein